MEEEKMSHEAYQIYILGKKCKIAERAIVLEKMINKLNFLKMIQELRRYHSYLTNEIRKLRRY